MTTHNFDNSEFAARVLNWYDVNARCLPWRSAPGEYADPYHVWLSEIMLQQTTVVTVGPYFDKFLQKWPTIEFLATAPLDDVLTAWAGLGYYARARNLHKCAATVWHKYGGVFPNSEKELLELPGVGPYTAAAIAAIAFSVPAVVVDGNIERIISRVFRVQEILPKARAELKEFAASVTPELRTGDYAQALMDIGSRICSPKKPSCSECPLVDLCAAHGKGDAEIYPKKMPKKAKPTKMASILWIENSDGEVLMRRREEKGLLGGMMEFPSTDWELVAEFETVGPGQLQSLIDELGMNALGSVDKTAELVKHTFTHFHLKLLPQILFVRANDLAASNHLRWIHPSKFTEIALPTLMAKVFASVKAEQGRLGFD
ncbi:A/G-specific adenine glycosylase [Alphaproteobacteria bacterium 46_93_T64]|nr:A/G-specific adenine glycosylase [Alphaproteobacteria bacterium 46_93_T64]